MAFSGEGLEGRLWVALRSSVVVNVGTCRVHFRLEVQVCLLLTFHLFVALKAVVQRYHIERHLQQTHKQHNSPPPLDLMFLREIRPNHHYAGKCIGQCQQHKAHTHTPVLRAQDHHERQACEQVHQALPRVRDDDNAGQELGDRYELEDD